MKKIKNTLDIQEFIIYFYYETWKGHLREQERSIKALSKENAKEVFKAWSKNQRAIVNAKILTIEKTKNIYSIEL
ncbi:hypothetical protein [uncultured Clostridium sp.]|uniref:hypothetical protein n=1 Tax=uncultured Clostridium sp. TaxID=59620 RepID=UPI002608FE32|nr:hypothetical protein [uncultured Clostridium sp.]